MYDNTTFDIPIKMLKPNNDSNPKALFNVSGGVMFRYEIPFPSTDYQNSKVCLLSLAWGKYQASDGNILPCYFHPFITRSYWQPLLSQHDTYHNTISTVNMVLSQHYIHYMDFYCPDFWFSFCSICASFCSLCASCVVWIGLLIVNMFLSNLIYTNVSGL